MMMIDILWPLYAPPKAMKQIKDEAAFRYAHAG